MKIAKEALSRDAKVIRAYGPGRINVSDVLYTQSLILAVDTVLEDWPPQRVEELDLQQFQPALALKPEILLVGTGASQRFLPGELMAKLAQGGVGVEVMDTAAACRTYNILLNEDRKVVAALLMI
ncbi:MAG TPA: Mth938-like domain-containing protein [Gammaproteobacteria bacterium]|nr:Mth938-like domain-containing protein [Gammaproteobacteria bacterium]